MSQPAVPFDPDFDQPAVATVSRRSVAATFDALPSKVAFILGFVTSLCVVAVSGFFLLLPVALRTLTTQPTSSRKTGSVVSAQPTAAPSAGAAVPSPAKISFRPVSDTDHIRGTKDAAITVIEYSDLECPFCKRVHPTLQRLLQEYDGKVRWVYRHFPLDSLHPKTRKEAEATECAGKLGGNEAFWKYVDRVFQITPSNDGLDPAQLPQIAQDVGLNRSAFESCLSSGQFAKHVQDDYTDATNAGGNGTPYSVVIDAKGRTTPVSGAVPYEQFKSVIDSLLSV